MHKERIQTIYVLITVATFVNNCWLLSDDRDRGLWWLKARILIRSYQAFPGWCHSGVAPCSTRAATNGRFHNVWWPQGHPWLGWRRGVLHHDVIMGRKLPSPLVSVHYPLFPIWYLLIFLKKSMIVMFPAARTDLFTSVSRRQDCVMSWDKWRIKSPDESPVNWHQDGYELKNHES